MKNSGTHFVNFKDHNAAAADLILFISDRRPPLHFAPFTPYLTYKFPR